MAEYASDSVPTSGQNKTQQRTPSAQHARRNNRNRKTHEGVAIANVDAIYNNGTVSDGAIANPASSPRRRPANAQRQHNTAISAIPRQQNNVSVHNIQKARPASMGGGPLQGTPAKNVEQAYAGSTFQASPAASSLPVPRFFSKSVPKGAALPTLRTQPADQHTPEDSNSSPGSDATSPVVPPEPPQSPLELFFKADRAEKEKSRSQSSTLTPAAARSSRNIIRPGGLTTTAKSGKSAFLGELDGEDSEAPSPGIKMSSGRPSVAERAHSSPSVPIKSSGDVDGERQAYTKSLKDMLFNAAANASMTPPRPSSQSKSGTQSPEGIFGPPSPLNSGPSTPQPNSDQQNHYSLHYGNRNLSPLFKAARADTPTRPSALRQEMPRDVNVTEDPALGFRAPPHPSSVDPSTFARSYLKDQIKNHGPAEIPQLPFISGPKPVHASGNLSGSGPVPIPAQPINAQHGAPAPAPSTTPRSGGPQDITTMENDLRRILKLNVLG